VVDGPTGVGSRKLAAFTTGADSSIRTGAVETGGSCLAAFGSDFFGLTLATFLAEPFFFAG